MAEASEQLKALVEEVNRGESRSSTVVAAREAAPDVKYKLDQVREDGDRVAFRYTATAKRGRAKWCGAGIGRATERGLHILHLSEDHIGKAIALGDFDSLDTPQDNITGHWTGEVYGVEFQMDLDQDPPADGVKGELTTLGTSFPLYGHNEPPTVILEGTSHEDGFTFKGKWESGDVIVGTLNGGGFRRKKVTISR